MIPHEPSDLDKVFKEKLYDHESAPMPYSWEKISEKIAVSEKSVKKQLIPHWGYYAVAASILFAVVGLSVLYYSGNSQNTISVNDKPETVHPDSVSSEKTISPILPQAKNDPSNITIDKKVIDVKKTSIDTQPVMLTTSTQDAEKELNLPDGSKVVLNRNSEIRYADNFTTERVVYVSGEASFDVKEDETHPFTVFGNLSKTVVLGTSFILRSFIQEQYDEINVTRGKVSFSRILENAERIIILAGNKAVIRGKDKPEQSSITDVNYNAWLTNKIVFHDTKLKTVLATLEKYYDVLVVTENPEIFNCRFTGSFERTHIDEILQVLSVSFNLSFNKESKNYTLSGKGCK